MLTVHVIAKCLEVCYNSGMYNWSTNEEILKRDPEKYAIWKLEQMVNFGLDGEKLNMEDLKKYWSRLALDPDRRKFLDLLIHGA